MVPIHTGSTFMPLGCNRNTELKNKMASCERMTPDSDEEVDEEALRLAALQSLHAKPKPKFAPHINHSNLIPIVPVNVVAPIIVNSKIKLEPISPTLERNIEVDSKLDIFGEEYEEENEDDKDSNNSGSGDEEEEEIEEDEADDDELSLDRLMDQLEAEISGAAPIPNNRTVLTSKKSSKKVKKKEKKSKKKKEIDAEVKLVEVKIGKQQGPVINIRESASPGPISREATPVKRNSLSPRRSKSPLRRSRTPLRRRSRSRSYSRRSLSFRRSPGWSPRRSRSPRSPYRRSRSPYYGRSRSPLRSPFRRSRSPYSRRLSPVRRYSRSRTRSRSFERRPPRWSLSPRRRSRSLSYFRDSLSPFSRKRADSKGRRKPSVSPRNSRSPRLSRSPRCSRSPRRRSRSPRRYPLRRNSPLRRSKSPLRRSRSPLRRSPIRRRTPIRRSLSLLGRRSKSPYNSPMQKRRSPLRSSRSPQRRSKSPTRRSASPGRRLKSPALSKLSPRVSPARGSKSPTKKFESPLKRSPRRSSSKGRRSLSFSVSPTPHRNRSPLRIGEKNKNGATDQIDKVKERPRRHRSLSKDGRSENRRRFDRRPHKARGFRRYSPSRNHRSADRQRRKSRSPRRKGSTEKNKEVEVPKVNAEEKVASPLPAESGAPMDPVLEARKKKFETMNEVDPKVDKKISLKAVKESTENADDDKDVLDIHVENDLWDESEESDDDHESRFKSAEPKKKTNRVVLSIRNLRDDGGGVKKTSIDLNKPLPDDTRRERFGRNDRFDRWQSRGRRNDHFGRSSKSKHQNDDRYQSSEVRRTRLKKSEAQNNKSPNDDGRSHKRQDRKIIMFASPRKEKHKGEVDKSKDNEVSTTANEVKVSENVKKISETEKCQTSEADDFDKLMSDFEKELESDELRLTDAEKIVPVPADVPDAKKPKISVKKDLFQSRVKPESLAKKPTFVKTSRVNDLPAHKTEKLSRPIDDSRRFVLEEEEEEGEINDDRSQPEDYIEDDDFVLNESPIKRKAKKPVEVEDSHSDLRAVLSRRRNERMHKAVMLPEKAPIIPNRLLQSAFQGLGNKKPGRPEREVRSQLELPSFSRNVAALGGENRRVHLLQREKKSPATSIKVTVPEVQPDTTIRSRHNRSDGRKRKRKIQMNMLCEEDEELEFEKEELDELDIEEEKPRRFRLKRNVTLSSQRSWPMRRASQYGQI